MKTEKKNVHIGYVGFKARPRLREYMFLVREGQAEVCEFRLTIPNEAFLSQRARYQDGPDICAHRVQQEIDLATGGPRVAKMFFRISEAELEAYRVSQAPKAKARTAFKSSWKPTDNVVS